MNNRAPANMALSEPAQLSGIIARFVTGFDLRNAPDAAVANARRAYIDTVGVMLAGSAQPAAAIVHGLIASEGSAPAASVVGTRLWTSVRLAALANGVASHGMDYDLSYLMGQPVASLIPALLPLAETTGAESSERLPPSSSASRLRPGCAAPIPITPTRAPGTRSERSAPSPARPRAPGCSNCRRQRSATRSELLPPCRVACRSTSAP